MNFSTTIRFSILHYALFCLIILFAFGIRVYHIGSIPEGALIDEAHFGYLAYSLLETGKDEHGVPWPLLFTGFGDYKLPMGVYTLLPFIKFFGLNNAVIRYPSILAGTILTLAAYLVAKEVTKNRNYGLLAALITALSPWTFILSRFGFESNLALCCLMFALWFSVRGLRSLSNWYFIFAGLFYALTWYAYIAYRPFTFVFIVILAIATALLHKKASLTLIVSLVLPFILLISIFFAPSLSKSNTARYNQVGILSDAGVVMVINESRTFCSMYFPATVCYAVWNKPSLIAEMLHNRFISSLSPDYLFLTGEPDGGMFSARGFALLYSILLPFYFIGMAGYFFTREKTKTDSVIKYLLLLGLLLSPIPAVMAGDPQRVRISVLYPFVLLTIIYGFKIMCKSISNTLIKRIILASVIVVLLLSFSRYLIEWFGVHVSKYDLRYQSYVPGLMTFLQAAVENENAKIMIKPFFSDPLMFYAYYTKMNPAQYQMLAKLGVLEASGFQHTVGLGNLKAENLSPAEAICAFEPSDGPIYFVTDEQLDLPLLYSGRSTNGVHPYVNVYNLDLSRETIICEN